MSTPFYTFWVLINDDVIKMSSAIPFLLGMTEKQKTVEEIVISTTGAVEKGLKKTKYCCSFIFFEP